MAFGKSRRHLGDDRPGNGRGGTRRSPHCRTGPRAACGEKICLDCPAVVMGDYLLTPQAAEDLFTIWTFIASDNVEAANRVEQTILASCVLLAGSPLAG